MVTGSAWRSAALRWARSLTRSRVHPEELATPEIDHLDPLCGAALAESTLGKHAWMFRKVDSVRLMEGQVGRRRISMDVLPPPDPRMAYVPGERRHPSIDAVQGSVMVPLALMKKQPLRNFDVRAADGRPLSVLGRMENAQLAASAFLSETTVPKPFADGALVEAVTSIVEGPAHEARGKAQELLSTGNLEGKSIIDPRNITDLGRGLLTDFAENFLLVVLIPSTDVGQRQVIKFSYHWDVNWTMKEARGRRLLAAAGYCSVPLDVSLSGPSDCRSYHLEVHAPDGLLCDRLTLPNGSATADDGGTDVHSDVQGGPVAHALASYSRPVDGDAVLDMSVPTSGLRTIAIVTSLFTASVFTLDRLLPGAAGALETASEGAVALLLAIPAIAAAFLARPGESNLTSNLMAPLRWLVVACSGLLLSGAASLVGGLHEPWMTALWCGGAVLSLAGTAFVIVGSFVSGARHTRSK